MGKIKDLSDRIRSARIWERNMGKGGMQSGDSEDRKNMQGGCEMDHTQHRPQRGEKLQPLDIIDGFQVRPGFYSRDGATLTTESASPYIPSVPPAVHCCCFTLRRRSLTPD